MDNLTYYKELKQKRANTIIMFRAGDYYISYENDANTIAVFLGNESTENNGVRMAIINNKELDILLPRAIRNGFKATIVERY